MSLTKLLEEHMINVTVNKSEKDYETCDKAGCTSEVAKRDREQDSAVADWCCLLLTLHCCESRCCSRAASHRRQSSSDSRHLRCVRVRDSNKYDDALKQEYCGVRVAYRTTDREDCSTVRLPITPLRSTRTPMSSSVQFHGPGNATLLISVGLISTVLQRHVTALLCARLRTRTCVK